MRIAMWSGPRNLSTAMMYAFGARDDTAVVDEPFYAAYLEDTGLDHPMRADVLASQATDPKVVAQALSGPVPAQKTHFYQKHMCQHMRPGFPLDWMREVTNVFLIRHPARVVESFQKKHADITLADIGFVQQTRLFERASALGETPVVIDSSDLRRDPEGMLRSLCSAIGLGWDRAMLSWPRGGHPDDGVWARHWYGAVHRSTTFAGADADLPLLSGRAQQLAAAAMPHYEALAAMRLRAIS